MRPKNAPPTISTGEGYKRELEYLYARRSAIDSLIRSLQDYDSARLRWSDLKKQKTA
jgi:hypothetical protein